MRLIHEIKMLIECDEDILDQIRKIESVFGSVEIISIARKEEFSKSSSDEFRAHKTAIEAAEKFRDISEPTDNEIYEAKKRALKWGEKFQQ